jgi:DNA polymerase-3 subunit delta'
MPMDPLGDEELTSALVHWADLDRSTAEKIAGPADGNLSLAMEMATSEGSVEYFQRFTEWMRLSFKGDLPQGMEWVEGIAGKGREWHKGFLIYALHILRQCMLHNLVDASKVRLSEEERSFEEKFRHYIPSEEVPAITEVLEEACSDIERNANPRILFFDTTLKLIRSFQNVKSR